VALTSDVQLVPAAVDRLQASLRGTLLRPGDPDYDAARRVWNARVDRRPALIAQCAGAADVIAAVNFARQHELPLAVKSGGHSVDGKSVCEGGLMIDLSRYMRGVRVDPRRCTALVQAGATWHDVTHEAQAFGLAVPGGAVSDVGVGGLTLGGGGGPLMRKYGMTVDNLLSVDLVTADGTLLTASATEHPDLFWGLRGGGGNFGVATAFEYRAHPVGPLVTAGLMLYPAERAADLLRFYRGYLAEAPDELFPVVSFMTAPPAPFVPASVQGQPIVAAFVCHCGSLEEGARAIAPLRAFGSPLVEQIGPMPYLVVQHLADAAQPPGRYYDRRAHHLDGLDDEIIRTLVAHAPGTVSPLSTIQVVLWGSGAVSRVPAGSTAVGPREAVAGVEYFAAWTDPAEAAQHLGWLADAWEALRPFARPEVNVNFLGDEDEARIRAAYGPDTYARLVALKQRYDPTNLFRLNHNIPPKVVEYG
jgi:FAD/FMN-containing dehydrogenase